MDASHGLDGRSGDVASPPDASSTDSAGPGAGLLVGYYADWRRSLLPPEQVAWGQLTHVVHAFVTAGTGGGLSSPDTFAYPALVAAAHAHGVKVLVSIGGADVDLTPAVGTVRARAATVKALVKLCSDYGYDGVDVDWEFPTASNVDAWATFLGDLRKSFDAVTPGQLVSATVASSPARIGILPPAILGSLSWVGALTYAYSGAGASTVGFLAPLNAANGTDPSVAGSIGYLLDTQGVPGAKVLLGLASYGDEFTGALQGDPITSNVTVTTLGAVAVTGLIGAAGWTQGWADAASAPFLQHSSSAAFVTYENAASIGAKCAYAHARHLGGALVWDLALGAAADGGGGVLSASQACR